MSCVCAVVWPFNPLSSTRGSRLKGGGGAVESKGTCFCQISDSIMFVTGGGAGYLPAPMMTHPQQQEFAQPSTEVTVCTEHVRTIRSPRRRVVHRGPPIQAVPHCQCSVGWTSSRPACVSVSSFPSATGKTSGRCAGLRTIPPPGGPVPGYPRLRQWIVPVNRVVCILPGRSRKKTRKPGNLLRAKRV